MWMAIAGAVLVLGACSPVYARSDGGALGRPVYEDPTARVWLSDPEPEEVADATSLVDLVHAADLIARAQISNPDAGSAGVEAELIEVLKGDVPLGSFTFAPRNPGSAGEYAAGEEVLLFLERIEHDAEGADTRLESTDYVSLQEGADEVVLTTPRARDAFAAAVRAYVAADALTDPTAQLEARRRAATQLLQSSDPRLAAWAAQDLAAGDATTAIARAELPALEPVIDDPRVPITTRVALLATLEQQRLVFGPARWIQLLRKTRGRDLLVVVRAAATRPSAGITEELGRLVQQGEVEVATAAAVGLGHPGNTAAVEPLARALGRDVTVLRLAVLGSLARIGTFGARHVLEMAASSHPDPATRTRASMEAIALARRQGTTLAPMLAGSASVATAPQAAPSDVRGGP